MFGTQFFLDRRWPPLAPGSPETLVVLLDEPGPAAGELISAATRWMEVVPTTAFVALRGVQEAAATSLPPQLNHAARHLEPVLAHELSMRHLGVGRLILVGIGSGGTLALHMTLLRGWNCAGVLAFGAKPPRSIPRLPKTSAKVRLIGIRHQTDADSCTQRNFVAALTARGIDTRGVQLGTQALTDEAVRHGAAYLVELVATAQGNARIDVDFTDAG